MFIISGQTVISVILEFRNKRTLEDMWGEKKRCVETINLLDPRRAIPDHVVSWRQRLPTVAFAGTMTH